LRHGSGSEMLMDGACFGADFGEVFHHLKTVAEAQAFLEVRSELRGKQPVFPASWACGTITAIIAVMCSFWRQSHLVPAKGTSTTMRVCRAQHPVITIFQNKGRQPMLFV
jgi:hypothetical protein